MVTPDGKFIPFDTFNLFYRDDLKRERLIPIRRGLDASREAFRHALGADGTE